MGRWHRRGALLLADVLLAVSVSGCPAPGSGPAADGSEARSGRVSGQVSFSVVASGDLVIHDGVRAQAQADAKRTDRAGFDFFPELAGVADVMRSADLAICHLEVPLARPQGPFTGYPSFSAPPQLTGALARMGVDVCSTASNHTLDKGAAGVRATLDALDRARIRHVGSARSAREAAQPALLDAGGVRVAMLAYTYGFNGGSPPAAQSWLANKIDPQRVLADAHRARAAGAQVVLVNLHWGQEFHHEPTRQQRELARRLLTSPDIDVIIGQHTHVVQPIERVSGKWVVYGEGNLLAARSHNFAGGATHEGIIPRLTFTRRGDGRYAVTRVEVFPTLIDSTGPLRVVLASAMRVDPRSPDRARAQQAWERTRHIVLSAGAGPHGLVVR